jgi:hypothetical protein
MTLVQARHLQIDSSLLSYSSRRPVDENIKLEGRKEEVEKQETSRYRWMYGHVSQGRIKPSQLSSVPSDIKLSHQHHQHNAHMYHIIN